MLRTDPIIEKKLIKKSKRKKKKVKLDKKNNIEDKSIEIEGKNIIEKFFTVIAILWVDTPVGVIGWIIILFLFAAIFSGGDLECGRPAFFGHDGC